jgi:K+/H+ antiporter YhaU regulatory subunit KhtT
MNQDLILEHFKSLKSDQKDMLQYIREHMETENVNMDKINEKISAISERLARIEERVEHQQKRWAAINTGLSALVAGVITTLWK